VLFIIKPTGAALGLIVKSYRDYFWVKFKERDSVLTYARFTLLFCYS